MKQKLIKKIVLQEKGSALVMTLGVLLILSILGISIGALTIGSYRLSDANRDDTSAYYIAEAGAEMAYEEISSQVWTAYNEASTEPDSFFTDISNFNKEYSNFEEQGNSLPTATVVVEPIEGVTSRTYKISSTGKVGNKKRVVQKEFVVNWVEKSTGGGLPSIPEGTALIANNKIVLRGLGLKGTAYIYSEVDQPVKLYSKPNNTDIKFVYPGNISIKNMVDYSEIESSFNTGKLETTERNIRIYLEKMFVTKKIETPWETYIKMLGQEFFEEIVISKKITNKLDQFNYQKDQYNNYDVIDYDGNLLLNSWMLDEYTLNLESNIYIPKIKIANSKTLTINANSGNYIILIDDIENLGNFKVTGEGNVTFIINEAFTISGSGNFEVAGEGNITFLINKAFTISGGGNFEVAGEGNVTFVVNRTFKILNSRNLNKNGTSKNLTLIYLGEDLLDLSGDGLINAHLLVKAADINISSTNINGVLLTGSGLVNLSGGNGESNLMLIAPNASVNMSGSYKINGTVIANNFQMSGSAKLIYGEVDTTGFPLLSSGSVNPASKDDIIHAEPILEK